MNETPLIVVRGGGDLGTGAIYRLHRAGFPIVVTELEKPLAIRREVSVASAVFEGSAQIESMEARLANDPAHAMEIAATGAIPVLVDPGIPLRADVIVDARLAKRNIDTHLSDAPLVIALGPGFQAGVDCHAVVETQRGHHLGRVLWEGSAQLNTGTPGLIGASTRQRVVRAPCQGSVTWHVTIGDIVLEGDPMGTIGGITTTAPLAGAVRGLIHPLVPAVTGLKVADIDPRGEIIHCFEISDKALSVGGGVLEAVMTWKARAP